MTGRYLHRPTVAPAAAGASSERGYYTFGTTAKGWSARRGTIRMEET